MTCLVDGSTQESSSAAAQPQISESGAQLVVEVSTARNRSGIEVSFGNVSPSEKLKTTASVPVNIGKAALVVPEGVIFDQRIVARLSKDEKDNGYAQLLAAWNHSGSSTLYSGRISDHSHRNLTPFVIQAHKTIERRMADVLKRPLARVDRNRQGHIYVYSFPGQFGQVKIGYTSKSVAERLAGWRSTCKHDPQCIYPTELDQAVMICHPNKVERLVHAELNQYRHKEMKCHGCAGNHEEWFLVPRYEYAREVVQKWIKWIATGPYNTETGYLKDRRETSIKQLCERIPVPPLPQPRPHLMIKRRSESASPSLRQSTRVALRRTISSSQALKSD